MCSYFSELERCSSFVEKPTRKRHRCCCLEEAQVNGVFSQVAVGGLKECGVKSGGHSGTEPGEAPQQRPLIQDPVDATISSLRPLTHRCSDLPQSEIPHFRGRLGRSWHRDV
ncbi:uncharacterized protein V6R79_002843 [Siganus canaliculatus]